MTLAPRNFGGFRAGLLIAYEEEISGIAYFEALASQHDGRAREALLLLAQMERVTAAAIHPLIVRHGLDPSSVSSLEADGRRQAENRRSRSWSELVAEMAEDFPAYVTEFEQVRSVAPDSDRAALEILIDYEIAAIDFARLEVALHPDSIAPVKAFLAAHGQEL